MSTRANVHFVYGQAESAIAANIYVHSDGYPEGLGQDILDFLTVLEGNVPDNRFGDPEYLAAKFLVWKANMNREGKNSKNSHLLGFTGVAPCIVDHTDIEYIYTVFCEVGKPIITFKDLYEDENAGDHDLVEFLKEDE